MVSKGLVSPYQGVAKGYTRGWVGLTKGLRWVPAVRFLQFVGFFSVAVCRLRPHPRRATATCARKALMRGDTKCVKLINDRVL